MTLRKIDVLEHESSGTPPADTDPPFLTNRVPAPGATGVAPTSNISFRLDDLLNPVNLSSVIVSVNRGSGFEIAYSGGGGGFQAGFLGAGSSVIPFGPNGYDFVIDPQVILPEFVIISARVEAVDTAPLLNALDQTYSFQVADVSSPFVVNHNPNPGATGVALNEDIFFKVDDSGSGVVENSIQVDIKRGADPFVPAIVNGNFQAGYSGSIVASGLGFNVTINPSVNFLNEQIIQVRVRATDTQAQNLDATHAFTTVIAVLSIPSLTKAKDGGYLVELIGSIPDGTYVVHVGPFGSASDPVCYSAIPGQGEVAEAKDGKITIALPPLIIGGPYAFTLVTVTGSGPPTIYTTPALTILPHEFRTRTMALRRLLPAWWKTGHRLPEQRGFPQ